MSASSAEKKSVTVTRRSRVAANNTKGARAPRVRTETITTTLVPKKTTRRNRGPARNGGKLDTYLSCLKDPWTCGPIRLGWGSFSTTGLHTAYKRYTFPLGTSTAFAICHTPQTFVAAANRGVAGYLKVYTDPLATVSLNAAASYVAGGADNTNYLQSTIQVSRVVSSSLRVVVRYGATAIRGTLKGLFLPEEQAGNVNLSPFTTLGAINATRWANSSSAGEIGIDVAYRPSDSVSFSFSMNGSLNSTNDMTAQHLVIGEGWPAGAGISIDVFQITHYETMSGLDAPGDDADAGDSLAASGVQMDLAGAHASRLQPVTPSISSIEMLDHALSTAARSGARTGIGFGPARLVNRPFLENGFGDTVMTNVSTQPSTSSSSPPLGTTPSGGFVLVRQPC